MGVTLPSYLDEALDLIGVNWPNVDEDDYREMAKAMREFADDIDDGAADAHAAIADLIGTNEGLAVQALERHWSKVKDVHLSNLAEGGRLAATALDGVAVLIEGAKLAAIAQLGILAAEIAAAIAAAPVTLGLSTLGGLAGTQVTRIAVKRIFQEVCEEVASRVIEVAMGPVYEALGSMAGDLVVQLGGNALGVQNGVDLSQTAKAGKEGLSEGVDAAKSGGAMQLASANGPSGGMGDLGGGGGGGQFSMDLASYDRVGSQLKGAGGKIRDGAGGKLSRAKSSHGRTKGKDPIADAANAMLDQVIDGIEKGVKRSAKHLDENMTGGLSKMAKRHRSNDDDIATELQSISKTSHGNTPVFHVDDEGRVTRLTSAGHQDLTDEDRARLGPLRLDSEGFVEDRKAVNYALPEVRHKKPSQQVEFGSTDLSQATQLARQANRDYGQYRKGKFSSRNYAAARYGQLGDQDGFILVGRSKFPGQHSERQVGIPFLDAGATDRMTELYTEREPCTTGSGARDCSAWMSHHLPDSVQVSHTVEYGATEDSKKQGNAQMEQYLNGLNPKKRSHN
ncbi:Xanthomonas XOO_2897-like deaminase [Streptomyces sp. cf386]|uniref:nucleic acid/nucleotide deaminase domain-containing protein n=1 Tax=Streptomyces sp. cf386 TaxID=1761904 RepID=UPI000889D03B|nr:nucleic acid/nucleotide deaminase domain-containing protein [Streptomyces sp. cf386]SDO19988.1 Xanthomonas XOO_2897-like deaminase [Streptomyces sp. cf386]